MSATTVIELWKTIRGNDLFVSLREGVFFVGRPISENKYPALVVETFFSLEQLGDWIRDEGQS